MPVGADGMGATVRAGVDYLDQVTEPKPNVDREGAALIANGGRDLRKP